MRSKNILLGILAIMLVFTMTAVGCNNGSTDNNDNSPQTNNKDSDPQTAIFQGIAAGYKYILTITENKSRAAYIAVTGDSYELHITKTGEADKVSKGKVSAVGTDGTLTLQPETAGSPTFSVNINGASIAAITGSITLADGTTVTAGDFEEGGEEPNPPTTQTFTTIAEMATWLAAQPANTATTPYAVKLNVSDFGSNSQTSGSAGYALIANSTKYVSLDLSDSTITELDYEGTWGITNLTSVTIPDSLTTIESSNTIFPGCTGLTAINTGAGNNTFSSQDGVLYNKDKTTLIRYPAGKTGSTFTIPNNVTSIKKNTFLDCTSLTNINIPASITTIEIQAFAYCTSLTSITIPTTVTKIEDFVFAGSTSLASVKFEGTITSDNFSDKAFWELGDLRAKYLATTGGGTGTYTTTAPVGKTSVWTKQN